jgi:DMSO/TMAO reductase YedYZ molybdopterin-dependent catalytic subunit
MSDERAGAAPSRHPISRRRALLGGLAAAGATVLGGCDGEAPSTAGSLLRLGDNLTWRAHRLLVRRGARVREYGVRDLTSFPAIGTTDPADARFAAFVPEQGAAYARLRARGFADWRLEIVGRVARPGTYSLADLRRFPAQRQITKLTCEEGWSAIAEWTGVALGDVLHAAGILPDARWVNFIPYDRNADGIDLVDAFHPQTLLAYEMNGRDLPVRHGAPVRLRVATQLGYKSVKFLRRIEVRARFDDLAPHGPIPNGWSWYAGI